MGTAQMMPLVLPVCSGSFEQGRGPAFCRGNNKSVSECDPMFCYNEKEGVEAVSVGAILSDYQRVRVENVCSRLQLQPLAYLWRREQADLLSEMISSGLQAFLIKVAAYGG
ncbi:diphthine--ammonia ligase [Tachysurus ichikawai]